MKLFKKCFIFLIVLATSLCFLGLGVNDVRAAQGDVFKLVADVSTLAVDDQIIIVASGSNNFALSTTQNDNNRGQIGITKNGDTIEYVNEVQIITLEAGTVDGTFAFKVGNGYLYAASSKSNHLKTQEKNDANGSWKITIANTGVATIKAQGTNTRNLMKYNSSSKIFSCYSSGQQDICIYKKDKSVEIPAEVYFDNNTGNGERTLGTVTNGLADKPKEDPKRDGYTFGGWYKESTCENAWNFETDVVEGEVILYAKWTANSSTIVFSEMTTKTSLMLDYTKTYNKDSNYIETVTYDFTKNDDFLTNWGSGYSEHSLEYIHGTVTFASANKQTSTITDCPVTKGGTVSFNSLDGYYIQSFTFECKQWTNKEQTISGYYSTDGKNYTKWASPSSNFTYSSDDLPSKEVNSIRITFGNSNQVGISKLILKLRSLNDVELNEAALRFGTSMPSTLYDSLVKEGATEFGVVYTKGSVDNLTVETKGAQKVAMTPVKVTSEWGEIVANDGEYTQFALVLTGIGYENIGTSVTARVYVVVNGVTYYMQQATHSVKTVCQAYISGHLADEHSQILNYIKDYVVE